MRYPSLKIANYFISKAIDEDKPLTPMQILKLVYIAHGWTLGLIGQPLIDDKVYAWKYGPVIPAIYHAFKARGARPVTNTLLGYQLDDFDENVLTILNFVWQSYGHMDGPLLSALTHADETPWSKCYIPNNYDIEIKDDCIKAHYELLKERYKNISLSESNVAGRA